MAAPVFEEELPTYFNCASRIYEITRESLAHRGGSFGPFEFFREFAKVGHVTTYDIVVLVVLSVLWTVLRHLLTSVVFVVRAQIYIKI